MKIFDQDSYNVTTVGPGGEEARTFSPYFFDGSDALANQNYLIHITHVPTNKMIRFKAFITSFNDTFSQDWNSETVYGRADPIYNFKQTTRKISLGFKMVAASESEAYQNLAKAQQLAQFMYPNYTDVDGAKTVSQGPLVRLKVMNLLRQPMAESAGDNAQNPDPKVLYDSYNSGADIDGMLGFFSDVTFNWNVENTDAGVFQKNGAILPKLIEVSVGNFSPIHEQHLGWDADNLFGDGNNAFPYGAQGVEDPPPYQGAVARPKSSYEKPAYSENELSKDERAQAEAAIANAQARYGGMFGNMRRNRDERRLSQGKLSGDKGDYIASALAGQAGIESGFLDDGSLSDSEAEGVNLSNSLYDVFVE
jgi:hypothetical protein